MSEQDKIRDLCAKVSAAPEGSVEFLKAVADLRLELSQQTSRLRNMVAERRKIGLHRGSDSSEN